MKVFSHLNTAVQLIRNYKGEEPFNHFIKKFFAEHKKYGSKDRKRISQLCYCYFRLGLALPELTIEEKIATGLFLCNNVSDDLLIAIKPEWNKEIGLPIAEKIFYLEAQLKTAGSISTKIFDWSNELSDGIDHEEFRLSHLKQPDLFIRMRPGKENAVEHTLNNAAIPFKKLSNSCIAFPNSTKINEVIDLNKEAVVQDYNSQRVGEFLLFGKRERPVGKLHVWDCCAASGGKSIMAADLLHDIELTVSDVRASILINLKKRFAEAGIKNYNSFLCDLSKTPSSKVCHPELVEGQHSPFDLIIADLPCTGSGTWSRAPEHLVFFKEEKIEHYAQLQKKILRNVIPHLKKDGRLLYSTCSVFKKENEETVNFLEQEFKLMVLGMEVLKGYDKKADTMFAALLSV